jgi:hypothetical protein
MAIVQKQADKYNTIHTFIASSIVKDLLGVYL